MEHSASHDDIIDARTGLAGVLVDLVSGQPIRWAQWANLTTGEFRAFRSDPKVAKALGIPTRTLIYTGRTQLRWLPTKKAEPASKLAEPLHKYTTGDIRRGRPLKLLGVPCDTPSCYRDACWEVADEVELQPIKHNGRRFEHADIINVRFYCDWCYKPPRIYDAKGELIREENEIGARP